MAYGRVGYTKGALRINAFGNFLDAEAPNLLRVRPGHAGPDRPRRSRPRPTTSRSATRTCSAGKHILTYGGNLRQNNFDISLGPGRRPQRVRRLRAVGVLRRQVPHRRGRPRRQVRQPRRPGLLAPRQRHVQAHARPLDPGVLQPRLRVALVHQQLPGPEHLSTPRPIDLTPLKPPARAGRRPLVPPPFLLTVNAFGNPDLKEQSTDALRGGLHRHVRRKDHGRAGRLPDRHRRQHQLHLRLPAGHPGLSARRPTTA